jgi:hypothetical protein
MISNVHISGCILWKDEAAWLSLAITLFDNIVHAFSVACWVRKKPSSQYSLAGFVILFVHISSCMLSNEKCSCCHSSLATSFQSVFACTQQHGYVFLLVHNFIYMGPGQNSFFRLANNSHVRTKHCVLTSLPCYNVSLLQQLPWWILEDYWNFLLPEWTSTHQHTMKDGMVMTKKQFSVGF